MGIPCSGCGKQECEDGFECYTELGLVCQENHRGFCRSDELEQAAKDDLEVGEHPVKSHTAEVIQVVFHNEGRTVPLSTMRNIADESRRKARADRFGPVTRAD